MKAHVTIFVNDYGSKVNIFVKFTFTYMYSILNIKERYIKFHFVCSLILLFGLFSDADVLAREIENVYVVFIGTDVALTLTQPTVNENK